MKINFAQIYEGWRNNLVPPADLKTQIIEVGKERTKICLECEHHSMYHKTNRPDDHCTQCGCTLSAKTKCLSCSCPVNKWLAVLESPEIEQEVKNAADNG